MKIKNIIFDIGNVILEFKYNEVIEKFVSTEEEKKFILNNIINSPEWLGYGLIDTGFITQEEAIKIVQDRTNHSNDKLIENFWMNYNNYAKINKEVLAIIKNLKEEGYSIYLLSNINQYTVDFINKTSDLFMNVDGYVLSYQVHQIKPYISIYKTLINKYNLNPEESVFIDDNQKNIHMGNCVGFKSIKVNPDDIDDLKKSLKIIIKKIYDIIL